MGYDGNKNVERGGMDTIPVLAYPTRVMIIMNQGIYFLHVLNSQSQDTAMNLQARAPLRYISVQMQ
jgi:hypothetical protein